ncbi:ribonuclease J [Salinibius halmophilus]|uniref:ribonuclease J n=1 Tax=Salinibius halmophilus TaxID=1853216 RepID=UPI000E660D50|nr:ribonuclease J [Salinibius halmophilus]
MELHPEQLYFLPLGGTGEIGMNLNLYGYNNHWLMVDCGITFSKLPGEPDVQMPDPSFIASRREQLTGIVITHAHEDHLGALPYLWSMLQVPIYATPFAGAVIERKMAEALLLDKIDLRIVDTSRPLVLGDFSLQWVNLTHSIPEPYGLLIQTPAGNVFHTADWKLDPDPVVGWPVDPKWYKNLQGVDAMVCDSTNANQAGHSISEGALYEGLYDQVVGCQGRVVVTCFASNLARLHTLLGVARDCQRDVVLLGRSLQTMVRLAKRLDYWPQDLPNFVHPNEMGYIPERHLMVIATGSQGEPRAALARMAAGMFREFDLTSGDKVIFSSRAIPGNEESIARVQNQLRALGVQVVDDDNAGKPIHASGHPASDELELMYQWVQPHLLVPTHGEVQHMAANAKIAKAAGVQRTLTGVNGDLFMLCPQVGVQRKAAVVGRLGYDNGRLAAVLPADDNA